MTQTADMLRLSLTDSYDFETITRATQMRRFMTRIDAGDPIKSHDVNTFIDDTMPCAEIFERVLTAMNLDPSLHVAKHVLSPHRVVYDVMTEKRSFLFSLWATNIGSNSESYISAKIEHELGLMIAARRQQDQLREVAVEVYGDPFFTDPAYELLKEELHKLTDERKRSVVQWKYKTDNGIDSVLLSVEKDWEMHQEAYPWMTRPLNDYYKDYVNSPNSILICYGPPGTGKTSFIRDLLCEQRLNSVVSYDADILASDEMFTFFLSSPAYDVIVIEDADEMLTSDREVNNKMIAKLLNASDGLLKLPRKKIILSTNLEKVSHIDEAITRPGRCFDMLHFRKLTGDEQGALATKLGVPPPDANQKGASLAEVYYTGNYKQNIKKLGF